MSPSQFANSILSPRPTQNALPLLIATRYSAPLSSHRATVPPSTHFLLRPPHSPICFTTSRLQLRQFASVIFSLGTNLLLRSRPHISSSLTVRLLATHAFQSHRALHAALVLHHDHPDTFSACLAHIPCKSQQNGLSFTRSHAGHDFANGPTSCRQPEFFINEKLDFVQMCPPHFIVPLARAF